MAEYIKEHLICLENANLNKTEEHSLLTIEAELSYLYDEIDRLEEELKNKKDS